jgi:hypothetical protein
MTSRFAAAISVTVTTQLALFGGIRPLTETTLQEAVALGQNATADAVSELSTPVGVFVTVYGGIPAIVKNATLSERFKSLVDSPYNISFLTPFTRAAFAVLEAKRKYEPQPTLKADDLNAGKVIVHISPGGDFTRLATIENVIIKRNGEIIRPLRAAVQPKVVQNRLGASATTAEGSFTFDFSVFEPSAAITLVLIGKEGNYEWWMSTDELARLR